MLSDTSNTVPILSTAHDKKLHRGEFHVYCFIFLSSTMQFWRKWKHANCKPSKEYKSYLDTNTWTRICSLNHNWWLLTRLLYQLSPIHCNKLQIHICFKVSTNFVSVCASYMCTKQWLFQTLVSFLRLLFWSSRQIFQHAFCHPWVLILVEILYQ